MVSEKHLKSSVAGSPPAGHRKTLFIILISVALVLVMAASLVYVFRMRIFRWITPEIYTQLAIGRTLENARDRAASIIDLCKYDGEAVSHSLDYETDKVRADSELRIDPESREALLEYSFETYGLQYDNNQIYITPELIAISAPDITFFVDCLTVDSATFADEWTANGWNEYFEMPDLENVLQGLFGTNAKSKNAVQQQGEILGLFKNAEFADDGTVTGDVCGEKMRLDVMTYVFAGKEVTEFYQAYPFILKDNSFECREDLVIHLFVDRTGYVRKISTEEFAVLYDGEDKDVRLAVELGGDKYPTDIWNVDMTTVTDGISDVTRIETVSGYDDSAFTSETELTKESDNLSTNYSVTIDLAWNKKDTSGENFSLHAAGEGSELDYSDIKITGELTDTDTGTSLSDAKMESIHASGRAKEVTFDYAAAIIDQPDISFDTSDSTPLMEYLPFLIYMEFLAWF